MTTAATHLRRAGAVILATLLALTATGLTATAADTDSDWRWMTGRVINPDGSPAANTEVLAFPEVDGEYGYQRYTTQTDQNGYYEFTTTPGTKARILVVGDNTFANTWYGGGVRLSQAKDFITTTDRSQTFPTLTRQLGATVTMQINDKREGPTVWTVDVRFYDSATSTWQHVAEAAIYQYVVTQDSKGGIRLDGLPAGVPLRISMRPFAQIIFGFTFADWPYFYGGGRTFDDGPARAFPAGTTNLGTLDMVKLNPSVDHGLTTPKLSKNRQTYGHKNTAVVTVTHTGRRTGTVTFTSGNRTLGTAELVDRKATFRLPKNLKPGTHKVIARATGLESKPVTLTVAKAKLAKPATITSRKFTKDTRPKVTVTLGKLNNGAYPTGKIRVIVGSKTVKTITLKANAKGRATVTLPAKYSKAIKVKATYLGITTTAKATTKTVTIKTKTK